MLRVTYHFLKQWFIFVPLIVGGTLVAAILEPYLSLLSLTMIYVVVVVIASYLLSRNQSILCAILSVASLNFFFVPPRFTFHVEGSEHLIALCALLLVALIINSLVARLKNETIVAKLNEKRARQLQLLAIDIANANTIATVQTIGASAFSSAFPYISALYLIDDKKMLRHTTALPQPIRDGLYACMKEKKMIGAGTGRWNELAHWFIPIGDQEMYGAICLQEVANDDLAGREHALALTSLVAQGLHRLQLSNTINDAQKEIERQQLQAMFLSAISHDLRTPLSVVIGAASAIQTQGDKLAPAEQQRLLNTIIEEAAYLCTITENTLQLVKLKEVKQAIRTDWESVEEIIGAVLSRIKKRHNNHRIHYHIPTTLPLIQVDAVLIAQLVSNLVDNALKYSEDEVQLQVTLLEEISQTILSIEVKDRGPGIPLEEQESVFEAYTHSKQHDQSSQRGAGLGLAVCRAIARAHGGELNVKIRSGGGCNFILHLPLAAQLRNDIKVIQTEEAK